MGPASLQDEASRLFSGKAFPAIAHTAPHLSSIASILSTTIGSRCPGRRAADAGSCRCPTGRAMSTAERLPSSQLPAAPREPCYIDASYCAWRLCAPPIYASFDAQPRQAEAPPRRLMLRRRRGRHSVSMSLIAAQAASDADWRLYERRRTRRLLRPAYHVAAPCHFSTISPGMPRPALFPMPDRWRRSRHDY